MVEVEVLKDNFKDLENFNKVITIKRNEKEITVIGKLLQKGDTYFITKERYKVLSKKGIVQKASKEKQEEQ